MRFRSRFCCQRRKVNLFPSSNTLRRYTKLDCTPYITNIDFLVTNENISFIESIRISNIYCINKTQRSSIVYVISLCRMYSQSLVSFLYLFFSIIMTYNYLFFLLDNSLTNKNLFIENISSLMNNKKLQQFLSTFLKLYRIGDLLLPSS